MIKQAFKNNVCRSLNLQMYLALNVLINIFLCIFKVVKIAGLRLPRFYANVNAKHDTDTKNWRSMIRKYLGFTNSILAHSLSKSLLPSEDAFKASCKN